MYDIVPRYINPGLFLNYGYPQLLPRETITIHQQAPGIPMNNKGVLYLAHVQRYTLSLVPEKRFTCASRV